MMKDFIETPQVKSGDVLLSEPFMWDNNFKRAAILLCEHTQDGTLGFILNKPLNMRIDELIGDFPDCEAEVYFGGPVQTDTIHYVHNVGDLLEDSTKVVDGVYWGGSYSKLKFLIENGLIKPENIRFFVGYSGWSSGQLNEELETGSWIVTEMFANYLFRLDAQQLWSKMMYDKGNTFTVIAQMPEGTDCN